MKILVSLASAAALVTSCADAPTAPQEVPPRIEASFGAVVENTNDNYPFRALVAVPCAAGGSGELVELTGTLHIRSHVTETPSGHFAITGLFHTIGLTGVGQTTGVTYRAIEMHHGINTFGPLFAPQTFLTTMTLRIIGQGRGGNYLLRWVLHITFNANDELTVEFEDFKVICD